MSCEILTLWLVPLKGLKKRLIVRMRKTFLVLNFLTTAIADWGFSYGAFLIFCCGRLILNNDCPCLGTVIGQYMVKILSPDRLGKLVVDGVVNVDLWNGFGTTIFDRESQCLRIASMS
jgi:hypothetical protein